MIFGRKTLVKPFTITTFYPGGDPGGFRISEMTNKTIQAFYIPRNILKDVIDSTSQLSWSGVYTLFDSADINERNVYIGEAEDVGSRLKQHNVESEEWWNVAVVFVINNKEHQLTKADIKFLENYMYTRAKKSETFNLRNSNTPHQSFVNESRKYDLYEIFENIDLLLRSLGFPVFFNSLKSKTTSNPRKDDLVYLTGRDSHGVAKYTSSGLAVQKGSKISPLELSRTFDRKDQLEELISKGIIKDNEFTKDYVFSTPSAAGTIIYKARCNGWTIWKNKEGKTLSDLYR